MFYIISYMVIIGLFTRVCMGLTSSLYGSFRTKTVILSYEDQLAVLLGDSDTVSNSVIKDIMDKINSSHYLGVLVFSIFSVILHLAIALVCPILPIYILVGVTVSFRLMTLLFSDWYIKYSADSNTFGTNGVEILMSIVAGATYYLFLLNSINISS